MFAWGLGLFLGPTLGALLAFPCANRTNCPQILQAHPFLLSFALVGTMHAAIGVSLFFLRESKDLWREREVGKIVGSVEDGAMESAVEEVGKVGLTRPLLKSPEAVPEIDRTLSAAEKGVEAQNKWHVMASISMSASLYFLQVYAGQSPLSISALPASVHRVWCEELRGAHRSRGIGPPSVGLIRDVWR